MGRVVEVFDSIQGEGTIVGCRQIFIRLAGCNLECSYCDTRWLDGQGMTVDEVMTKVEVLKPFPIHSVAITGGEPLLQLPFTQELCKAIRESGRKAYLETNGTLFDAMESINQDVDYVAMDIKLEKVGGQPNQFKLNQAFLRWAYNSGWNQVIVKIVVAPNVCIEHLLPALDIVRDIGIHIPVILQPVTGKRFTPYYLDLQKAALETGLTDVRVVPQVHRYIDVR